MTKRAGENHSKRAPNRRYTPYMDTWTATVVFGVSSAETRELATTLSGRLPKGSLFTTGDARELLRAVKRHRPKLVIVPSDLTPLAGDALLARLKQDRRLERLPVFILLSSQDADHRKKFLFLGAHGVFVLPLDHQEFFQTVSRFLSIQYRKCVRFPVLFTGRTIWEEQEISLSSVNLSKSGVLFEVPVEIQREAVLKVHFSPQDGEGELTLPCLVVRTAGHPPNRKVATRFLPLPPQDAYRLERFLLREAQRRSHIRSGYFPSLS